MGFTLASTIMVGQSMGAGKKDEAEKLAWRIVAICGSIILVYSIGLFIFSSGIASIFTSDMAVINAASDYNKIAAAILVFTAVEVVLEGAFSGAGDTMPPALITMPFNVLRIPLAALLAPEMGLNGIWIAIAVSNICKGILMAVWFKKGKWKLKSLRIINEKDHLQEIKSAD
jgi:Na+-driven multidrug efflux pump